MTERQLGVADESQSPPIDPRPPLLVKVTGYRLLDITLLLAFGIAKAVLTYWERSVISAPLDWIMGTLIVIMIALFWLGLYENVDPPIWKPFFHHDYSGPIFSTLQAVYNGAFITCLSDRFGFVTHIELLTESEK